VAHGRQLQAVARLDCSLPLVFRFAFSSLHYQASSPSTLPIYVLLHSPLCFKLPPSSLRSPLCSKIFPLFSLSFLPLSLVPNKNRPSLSFFFFSLLVFQPSLSFQKLYLSSFPSPQKTSPGAAAKGSIYRRRGSGEGIIAHGEQGTRWLVG